MTTGISVVLSLADKGFVAGMSAAQVAAKKFEQSSNQSSDAMEKLDKNLKKTKGSLSEVAKMTMAKGWAEKLIETEKKLKAVDTLMSKMGRSTALIQRQNELNNALSEAKMHAEKFGINLGNAKQKAIELTGAIRKAEIQAEKLAKKEVNQANFDKAKIRAVEAAAGLYLVKNAVQSVVDPALKFGKSMSLVSTIVDTSQVNMKALSADARKMGVEFGMAAPMVGDAMYQAVSAGISADKVGEFMRVAGAAAVGGGTDIETAVDGISGVMNAYGTKIMSAQKASDMMFMTTVRGKATIKQLSEALYQVNPIAASLGVSFKDVSGAISTLTANNVPVSVASTQLRAVFAELMNDTTKVAKSFEDLSGKSFKKFIAGGGDVQGALTILSNGAAKSGKTIESFFSQIEAKGAVLGLTGINAQRFSDDLKAIGNSSNSTAEAFGKVADGAAFKMTQMNAKIDDIKIAMGDRLLPVVTAVGGAIGSFADKIMFIYDKAPLIVDILLATAGAFAVVKTGVIAVSYAQAAWNAIMLANPIVGIGVAVVGAAILIYKYWTPIKEFFAGIFDKIAAVGGAVTSFFGFGGKKKPTIEKAGENEYYDAEGSFATGSPYIPHDNFRAILHKGERVMTAKENQNFSQQNTKSVQNTFHNVFNISGSNITAEDVINQIVPKLEFAIQNARG